jgi:predicted metal-binding membrane protein
VGTLTGHSQLIDHDYLLEHSGLPLLAALVVFLACWQLMTAAMIVPSSLPILQRNSNTTTTGPRSRLAIFLAGYFLIWTGFAVAAFMGDMMIHILVESWTWLGEHSVVIGAATLAVAGGFQFTSLKLACLRACRAPFGDALDATGERPISLGAAWRFGLHHGLACLGSGWALMLVMFGIGVGGIGWMLALTGVMMVEKAVPGTRWLTPLVGIALLVFAAVWLAHPGWLPSVGA